MELSKTELSKRLGICVRKLDSLRKKGELKGWTERKVGRKLVYTQDKVQEIELSAELIQRKKLELTEAQIQKTLQQVEKKKDEIRKEYRNTILDELLLLLQPLKQSFTEAKLTDEQAGIITKVLTEVMDKLPTLKGI